MPENSTRPLLLRGARAVLSDGVVERAALTIEGGRIGRFVDEGEALPDHDVEPVDLSGLTLYPGFIDLHIHGAAGVDTMEAVANVLHRVAQVLAREGDTCWLPTLVPAPAEDYEQAVRAIEQLMSEQSSDPPAAKGARALGVHYEGPFVNTQQCGALRTNYFRTYRSSHDAESLPRVGRREARHMTTLAPEIEGGIELVRALVERGWIVSLGHTRAEVSKLEEARAAGARHMTHFLNAMSPLHHRAPGPIGWGLLRDDIGVDLIADGVHSDPLMLQLVVRCKSAARVALISDSIAPAGQGDGEYRVWGETITVRDGRTSNERGSIAGSVITMADGVRMMLRLGFAPHEVARMASTNPAQLLGLKDSRGSIAAGKRADLTALDSEGRVRLTIIDGKIEVDERSS